MPNLNRRNFLSAALAGTGAVFCFQGLLERTELFNSQKTYALENDDSIYGALVPTASANTGEIFLALPKGFQYNVFGKANSPMTNGQPTPVLPDGMTVFDLGNSWALIRNHEISALAGTSGTVSGTIPYDSLAGGGTSTLIINKTSRLPTAEFISLSGTLRNCAGGQTPWRTWITCEETVVGTSSGFARPHGYCFEVSPATQSPSTAPVALTQMGRFVHEAVAVDRRGGIVYLTEDNTPAGFYRFLPNNYGQLAAGGRLQMLAIRNQPNYNTRVGQTVGAVLLVDWVDIAEPNPPSASTNSLAVFNQGFGRGGASFARLEGCFAQNGRIYFTSTSGGNQSLGQIWEYRHRKHNTGYLKLIFESPNASVLNMPDNICFGRSGNLFICEDNPVENFIRVLRPNGSMSNFAKNIVPNFQATEFAGSVFSRDLQTLFVNLQAPGFTFAIWGNW